MRTLWLCLFLVVLGASIVPSKTATQVCAIDCDSAKLAPNAQRPESGWNTLFVIDKIGNAVFNAIRAKGRFGELGSAVGYLGMGVLLDVEAGIPNAPNQAEWYVHASISDNAITIHRTYYKLHNDLVQMQDYLTCKMTSLIGSMTKELEDYMDQKALHTFNQAIDGMY